MDFYWPSLAVKGSWTRLAWDPWINELPSSIVEPMLLFLFSLFGRGEIELLRSRWFLPIAVTRRSTILLSSFLAPSVPGAWLAFPLSTLMIFAPWPCFKYSEVSALKWLFLWNEGTICLGVNELNEGSCLINLWVSNKGFNFNPLWVKFLRAAPPIDVDRFPRVSERISSFLRYICSLFWRDSNTRCTDVLGWNLN